MDILECINGRRSVRSYTEEQLSREEINSLLHLAVKAATGSNRQPWGFAIIQDGPEILHLSDLCKAYLLDNLDVYPYARQYESPLRNEKFNIFNGAPTVLAIYGNTESHWIHNDGSMAAANIMLAGHSMGIGSCWIGFAHAYFNTQEFKTQYRVPESYELVCVLSLGHMVRKLGPSERKEPVVFHWE